MRSDAHLPQIGFAKSGLAQYLTGPCCGQPVAFQLTQQLFETFPSDLNVSGGVLNILVCQYPAVLLHLHFLGRLQEIGKSSERKRLADECR